MNTHSCRHCSEELHLTLADLGTAPPCNNIVPPHMFNEAEDTYPLHAYVCTNCRLVQVPAVVTRENVFNDNYSYFSSYSASWLAHSKRYVEDVVTRFGLGQQSRVTEIASNDGYLLQYFKQRDIPCYGVEPTANTAKVAIEKGIDTEQSFFGAGYACYLKHLRGWSDLIICNNVLAHVPDINDFVEGLKILLAKDGVITVEFPSLANLIEKNLWDTIYHEHFSYLSMTTVRDIFACFGLVVFDVEELPTHGGSLRIYARHVEDISKPVHNSVYDMMLTEEALGHYNNAYYAKFGERVKRSKRSILSWLTAVKRDGASVVGFGAPGKGNTLLNYCGVRNDFFDYVVDDSPHKQGNFLPGSRIPIRSPETIGETKPDYVVIMPWNLKDEIAAKLDYIKEWGGKCVVFLPEVEVLP